MLLNESSYENIIRAVNYVLLDEFSLDLIMSSTLGPTYGPTVELDLDGFLEADLIALDKHLKGASLAFMYYPGKEDQKFADLLRTICEPARRILQTTER